MRRVWPALLLLLSSTATDALRTGDDGLPLEAPTDVRAELLRLMAEAFDGQQPQRNLLLETPQVADEQDKNKAATSASPPKFQLPKGTKLRRRQSGSTDGAALGEQLQMPASIPRIRARDLPRFLYDNLEVEGTLPELDSRLDESTQRMYRTQLREAARRRKLLIDVARGKLDDHEYYKNVDPDSSNPHPIWPSWNPLWWRYQFALLLLSFIAVFVLELVLDFFWQQAVGTGDSRRGRKVQFSVRPSTVLRMGANSRVFTRVSLISGGCRCITCMFLHLHIFHLTTNCLLIYMSINYVYDGVIGKSEQFVWVMHWVFPLFFITGLAGSLYSLHTTLQSTGVSIGASGGCLGLGVALLALAMRAEGIPYDRRVQFGYVGFTIFVSCVPLAKLFDSSSDLDMGAHIAGAVTGLFTGLLLNNYAGSSRTEGDVVTLPKDLMVWGDYCSVGCLAAVAMAFLYVSGEYFTRTPRLVAQAFEDWNGVKSDKDFEGPRLSCPGRLRTELLDAEERWEAEHKHDCEDPEVVLRRFRDWMRWRRHSLGPGTDYGRPHNEQQDVEAKAAALA